MPLHQYRRPRHLFSGLVFCGVCGGACTIKNRDQLACVGHRENDTCDNGRTIRTDDLERRVLEGLRQRLLAPESIAQFVVDYNAERARLHEVDRRNRH
jgi:hypothetical protein